MLKSPTSIRRHTHFLDLDNALILSGFLLALALLKAELAVVHKPAHGRVGLRRDLDEVKPLLIGDVLCLRGGHNAKLLAR